MLLERFKYMIEEEPFQKHLDEMLPNWQIAKKHGQASKIGKQIKTTLNQQICQCCLNPINKSQISLNSNIKTLHFLGFGIPLFYLFMQCCIILSLLLIVTDSMSSIYRSFVNSQKQCLIYQTFFNPPVYHRPTEWTSPSIKLRNTIKKITFEDIDERQRIQCTNIFVYFSQIEQTLSTNQQIGRICSFIIHIFCLIFIKSNIIKRQQYYDQIYPHLSDYSVIIKQLKPQITNKTSKIHELFYELKRKYNLEFDIREIFVVPQNMNLQIKLTQRQQTLSHYLKLKDSENEKEIQLTINTLIKIQKQIIFQTTKSKIQLDKDTFQSKNVILIFQTERNKKNFLLHSLLIQSLESFQLLGNNLSTIIQQCPDPKQIIWTNLKHTAIRNFNIFLSWILTIFFLIATYFLFFYLQTEKQKYIQSWVLNKDPTSKDADHQQFMANLIGYSTWIAVIFYNKFFTPIIIQLIVKIQKHDNISNQDFSFALKYAISMFFTSSIMKIMVQAMKNQNYYRHDFGIIQEQSMMFIFSSFFLPILWIIHPKRLLHLLKRIWYKGNMTVTQAYANYLMAQYPYMIRKRYAEIIEMMWCSFLYIDLIPFGNVLVFFGLCFYYWIDKYNLLRRSSLNYSISGILSKKMLTLLDITILLRFIGSIIFDYQLRNHISTLNLIFVSVSLCFIILPWNKIFHYFDNQQFLLNEKPYTSLLKTKFKDDNYAKANPIQMYINNNLLLLRRTHQLSL